MASASARNRSFQCIAFTPPGLVDSSIASAASRAGGIGVLDLEFVSDAGAAAQAVRNLSGLPGERLGIKLHGEQEEFLAAVSASVPPGISFIILTAPASVNLQSRIQIVRSPDRRVFLEVTSVKQAMDAAAAGADGLIAKGQEAGGFVGEKTTFILLQQLLSKTARINLPVFARGGIGLHTAAACYAAGAAGVVLDTQLLMTRESPLPDSVKKALSAMDGSEPRLFRQNSDAACRVHIRPGSPLLADLRSGRFPGAEDGSEAARRRLIEKHLSWDDAHHRFWPLGQDIAIAAALSRKYDTVPAVLGAFNAAVASHIEAAKKSDMPAKHSPIAKSHGTELPIVQGPMARVSDCPSFAIRVAQEGGLPFIALAQLSGPEIRTLLEGVAGALGTRPWGVGIIGFNRQELFREQLDAVGSFAPRFAILAGGLPHQTSLLESRGTATYAHVASPDILDLFLNAGHKRFIFEGSECGGHIGPRSSFVLWDTMTERLAASSLLPSSPQDYHILFAGGIHDSRSALMVAALSSPLAEAGMRIGMLMGSAYLLTPDIVECGAIVEGYQKKVLDCCGTSVLEFSPGHALRCCLTPLASRFEALSQELTARGAPASEISARLEKLLLGTTRIASKGLARPGGFSGAGKAPLVAVDERIQQEEGLYMTGQLAALHDRTRTIRELHEAVTTGASRELAELHAPEPLCPARQSAPCDVAIVGIGCLFPQAGDLRTFWENILNKKNAITEVPADRWDWRLYFDQDRQAKDKIYSKWGGFMEDLVFDPTRFGLPPKSLESIDPMQLMALEVARRTLADAGYEHREFDRQNASVILGASGGTGDLGVQYGLRSELPRFQGTLPEDVAARLPEWTEDSFPGLLLNVMAGRIANRLDFGGVNFTTDAACASSLAAIYQGVGELTAGRSSLVIAGGVDTVQGPFGYMCFSKTQALSPRGRSAAFDADADGIVISEGIGMVALKRLADAERDGDRIYAVIKGMGGSSDGKARGVTAPLPAGQLRAMRRAYEQAGFGPETVGLFEAHGTGTVVGDTAELESTSGLLLEAGSKPHSVVIGSVKNLIGHAKAAAGVAGLIKAALSLYHRVLPAHAGVNRPNALLEQPRTPLCLAAQPMPWLDGQDKPRRAAASAFGFGGTNFHAVLEEHTAGPRPGSPVRNWPSELLIWSGSNREELANSLGSALEGLEQGTPHDLHAVARRLGEGYQAGAETIAVVADHAADAANKIRAARSFLAGAASLAPGVYHGVRPAREPRVALLFPGQGSQYPGMFRELALHFSVYADALAQADRILSGTIAARFNGMQLSRFIFPRGCYDEQALERATKAMTGTDVAQPALGAVEAGLFALLKSFGLRPDMAGGHSYGEFAALFAAGVIDFEAFLLLSEARGRFIVDAVNKGGSDFGTMAAVRASRDAVEKMISNLDDVVVANHNAPRQCVISGSVSGVDQALARLSAEGVSATKIPVAAAFHSRYVQPARTALADLIAGMTWCKPEVPVYSNTGGDRHSDDPEEIKKIMADHLIRPVEFVAQVAAMHRDGARVFLELGPKSVLTKLTGSILKDREHAAIAIDSGGGIGSFLHAFAQMLCAGVPLNPAPLFAGRSPLRGAEDEAAGQDLKRAWLVNGSRARRAADQAKQVGVTMEHVRSRVTMPAAGGEPAKPGLDTAELLRLRMEARKPWSGKTDRGGSKQMSTNEQPSVMGAYLDLMKQFLEMQERIMSLHLGGAQNPATPRRQAMPLPQPVPFPAAPREQAERNQPARVGHAAPLRPEMPEPRNEPHAPAAAPPAPAMALPQERVLAASAPPLAARESEAKTSGHLDREKLTSLLLGIIETKTGYPPDMIGMNQNLEGDLGIDSIKRVEIVSALLKALPPVYAQSLGKDLGGLNTQATLAGMIDVLLEKVRPHAGAAAPFDQAGMGSAAGVRSHSFRHVMKPKQEPVSPFAARRLERGLFILTRDAGAVAENLALLLSERGCSVSIVERHVLQDETLLNQWCLSMPADSPVAGIVHLAPLGSGRLSPGSPVSAWRGQLQLNEKSLFILLHAFTARLAGAAHVLCASSLGGFFARRGAGEQGLSLQGGGPGLLKSLNEERPSFRLKAVDMDPGRSADEIAGCLLDELELDGGRQEVGYPEGKRTIFETVARSVPRRQDRPGALRDSVVLATAGVKGVTAELLRELALPGNTLILTGRSPLEQEDLPALKKLKTPEDLRRHFVSEVRTGAVTMSPAEIRRKVKSVLAAREMRNNLDDFRKRGAAVEYHTVDVTDEKEMQALIEAIYKKYSRIDAVVHGAGIIEDKLLGDKTSASWSRVVETKVLGLLLLQKHLRSDSLRFFAVMSSVAGRYGNSGQTDYAAANELMNRLCCQLQQAWGNTVTVRAFCWGPWGPTAFGPGMVTPEMEQKFSEKGISLVTAEAGREVFRQEMTGTGEDEVEIICGQGPWEEREARLGALRVQAPAVQDGLRERTQKNSGGASVHAGSMISAE